MAFVVGGGGCGATITGTGAGAGAGTGVDVIARDDPPELFSSPRRRAALVWSAVRVVEAVCVA